MFFCVRCVVLLGASFVNFKTAQGTRRIGFFFMRLCQCSGSRRKGGAEQKDRASGTDSSCPFLAACSCYVMVLFAIAKLSLHFYSLNVSGPGEELGSRSVAWHAYPQW